eukprot:8761607-Prorocentrum_lima.AAC.1
MRKLLCRWSFILDKRAARDAQAFRASIDVQAFQAYLDTVCEEQQKYLAMHSQEGNSGRASPRST